MIKQHILPEDIQFIRDCIKAGQTNEQIAKYINEKIGKHDDLKTINSMLNESASGYMTAFRIAYIRTKSWEGPLLDGVETVFGAQARIETEQDLEVYYDEIEGFIRDMLGERSLYMMDRIKEELFDKQRPTFKPSC